MLLNTKDGVACDWCGFIQKNKFVYYSVESKGLEINSAAVSVVQLGRDLDVDVCEKCYKAMEEGVKKFIANGVKRGTIKCDFCPRVLSGNFKYHVLLIHKVTADKDIKEKGPADVQMNFMDFNLDDECFTSMANQVMNTRQTLKSGGLV